MSMSKSRLFETGTAAAAAAVLCAALAASAGCAGVKNMATMAGSAGATGATGTAGATGNAGVSGTAGTTGTSGTSGTGTDGGSDVACTASVSCMPPGGQYCGTIGNGCKGQSLDCGMCPGDGVCTFGLCIGGPSCVAITCTSGGSVKYCGTIGDGCGHAVDCGGCANGQSCSGGVCVTAGCTPISCNTAGGGRYCGKIGDGCGGTLDCGGCAAPLTCGGGGIASVCGATAGNCTPTSCTPTGGQYCGVIGNGCGGTEDCGACANGMACGTGATNLHVCPSTGPPVCQGLQCQLDKCTGGAETSISGKVYDPAGKNPLYNVLLYVPNQAVDPIPTGASCDRCDSPISGQPVAAGLSDATGHFVIHNAPHGTNIPLVIQIGKWRRQISLPTVTACQDNPFNDPTMVRLPRNQSEGHLPQIALSTGHSDAYDCLLRKIGISDSEFTADTGTGRVHMYVGGAGKSGDQGAKMSVSGMTFADSYGTLFPNYAKMSGYDMIVLQCEGEQLETEKAPYVGNMKRYADNGGRIFADHLHSYWIRGGLPPWPATANWIGVGKDLPSPVTANVDTTFPKGAALADWLVSTAATPTRGSISLIMGQHSVAETFPPSTQRWVWVPMNPNDSMMRQSTQYLTFNTPVETAAANQCGRVVFTDVHVSNAGDSSHPDVPFPNGCTAPLDMTPQEKTLEFMFFDLSSCVQVETGTPMTPAIPPPGAAPTPPPPAAPAPPAPPPPPPPPPPPMVN
jgi:hypothetical protein